MNRIGTSHIVFADLLVWGSAIVLIYGLRTLRRNSALSRALAVLCGCIVVAIVVVLLTADNLNHDAVFELAIIAIFLCLSLWNWNQAKVTDVAPSQFPK